MALIFTTSIIVDGDTTVPLKNIRSKDRHIYSVYLSGTFGSGTVTAFINADGTNDIAILDAAGVAISLTADGMFNFEANSDPQSPAKLVITVAGSSAAAINLNVMDNA